MRNLIKIFVCTHFLDQKDFPEIFSDEIYSGLQCGQFKPNLSCDYHDSSNKNVSKWNKYINEMTGIHWIGKNILDKKDCPEFIGLMHYRRYLPIKIEDLKPNVIVCSKFQLQNSILEDLCYHHPVMDPQTYLKTLSKDYHDIANEIDILKYMITNQEFHNFNMFLMHKDVFREYFNFILPCINTAIKCLKQNKKLIDSLHIYQQRFYGFILERMTSYWIDKFVKENKDIDIRMRTVQHFHIKNPLNSLWC